MRGRGAGWEGWGRGKVSKAAETEARQTESCSENERDRTETSGREKTVGVRERKWL